MTTAQKPDAIASICDDFREIIRDIGQHIAQGQQSEAQMASMRPGYGTGVYTHISHQMRKMLALVTTLSDAQSALESERQAHAAEVERLRDMLQLKFTEEQCIDLFAAALYISARGDETSVLSEENAERIAELLCDLSGVDLTAAIARGKT